MKDVDILLKYFIYISLKDYKNIYEAKRYNLIFKLIVASLKDGFLLILLSYSYSIIYIININLSKVLYIYEPL